MKPIQSCAIVWRGAPTVSVHHRQIYLCGRVAFLSCASEPFQRFGVGVIRADGEDRGDAELILFEGVPSLRQVLHQLSVTNFLVVRRQPRDDGEAALLLGRCLRSRTARPGCRYHRRHQ